MATIDETNHISSFSEEMLPQKTPKKIFGLRLAAFIEILVFLSIALLFDKYFGEGNRFLSINPHPFTILIVLISVQYGTLEGLFATALSTLCLYFNNIPEQAAQQSLFEYQYYLVKMPLLWFISAFVLGELRMRFEFENKRLAQELSDAKMRENVVAEEFNLLKASKENLEAYLVGETNTAIKTYEAIQGIESLSTAQIMLKLVEIIDSAIRAKKFSVYILGEYGFEVVDSKGWEKNDSFLLRISNEHPIFKEVAGNQRILSIINEEDEKYLQKEGVLAVPLIDPKTLKVFGMIKIEEMDFIDLNMLTIEAVKNLSLLISMAYANAKKYKNILSKSLFSSSNVLYSYSFFKILTEIFWELKTKKGIDTAILSFSNQRGKRIPLENIEMGESAFKSIVEKAFDTPVYIFSGDKTERDYHILAPGISLNEAHIKADIIEEHLHHDNYLKHFQFENSCYRI